MERLLGLRKRRGVLVAALLLAACVTEPLHGEYGRPGVDETIFDPVIERPKPVQVSQGKGGETR